jgi:hypothetical protein
VTRRTTEEITKNGLLPQTFAPDAVKKVVNPIQNAKKPTMRLDTMSMLTLYFMATSGKAGVTMGPRLSLLVRLLKVKTVMLTQWLHPS